MAKLSKSPTVTAMNDALSTEREHVETLMYNDKLSARDIKVLVGRICEDVKADTAARTEFLDIRNEIIELYEGRKKPKSDPYVGCANV